MIRGEDGMDRWAFVRSPCITPLQGIFTASRGSILISWFSIGASIWRMGSIMGSRILCFVFRVLLNWGSPGRLLYSTEGGFFRCIDNSRAVISGSPNMASQNRLGAM